MDSNSPRTVTCLGQPFAQNIHFPWTAIRPDCILPWTATFPEQSLALNSHSLRTATCPGQPFAQNGHLDSNSIRTAACLGQHLFQNGNLPWTAPICSKQPLASLDRNSLKTATCLGRASERPLALESHTPIFAQYGHLPWTATLGEQPLALDSQSLKTAICL